MFSTYLGQPCAFTVIEDDQALGDLSERERRILVGAVNVHVLTTPGLDLTVHVYAPFSDYTPRTTDDRTFDGRSRLYRRRRATIRVRSAVSATPAEVVDARQDVLLASTTRHVMISSDETAAARPEFFAPGDLRGRVLKRLRVAAPLVYDEIRDAELVRHMRPIRTRVKRMGDDTLFAPGTAFAGARMHPAGAAPQDAPRAVLIGMHWFEMGGAERWAFETVRLVREAGLQPIVLTSRDSHHELITRPELDGALLLPLSEATYLSQTPGSEQLLRALLENVDLRGVVVHHSQWLYDRLPFLKRSRPGLPVVDTTHILEFRGGGYPASSAKATDYIDLHHVISPALERWMTGVQEIPAERVVMAPLGGLTVDHEAEAVFGERSPDRPFTVAFVGRLARQKAPEVFVETAARIHRTRPDVRFIMHGHGELNQWVTDLVSAAGLEDVLERRDESVPVSRTLDDADLLAITSHNEGLTLTTLEAIAHGTPVVSTDVGAQANLVPAEALASRNAHRAVRQIAEIALRYVDDEGARRRLWESERAAERALLALPSAGDWFEELVSSW
ncbi:glycosyltransferase [Aeromicrobium sp. Sec7.5]|uniref:glycosyltransferase n=1 Tax=Aeromicrobium sp. Sec7.5 TaxID=3121276 RepID=UPI002FE49687